MKVCHTSSCVLLFDITCVIVYIVTFMDNLLGFISNAQKIGWFHAFILKKYLRDEGYDTDAIHDDIDEVDLCAPTVQSKWSSILAPESKSSNILAVISNEPQEVSNLCQYIYQVQCQCLLSCLSLNVNKI